MPLISLSQRRGGWLGVLCILGSISATPAWANLLSNGSFESPGSGCVAGATSLPSWSVSNNIDIINSSCTGGLPAADGSYFIDLTGSHAENGANDVGTVSQTIATQIGQQYSLSFYFGANPQAPLFTYPNDGPVKAMDLLLNGNLTGTYSLNTTGIAATNPQWTFESTSFTATSASTQISFRSLNGIVAPSDFGPLLDGVSVTAVPEPATVWLMLSALGLVPVIRRIRRE